MMPLKDIAAAWKSAPHLQSKPSRLATLGDPLYWYIVLAVGALCAALGFWLGS